MTASDVFATVSERAHMGMEYHCGMADYFDFLGLAGFKRMHEYRYMSEAACLRGVHRYYINHYNSLIPDGTGKTAPETVPAAWKNFTRQSVEPEARRDAVKSAMESWARWEHETKDLYEQCYLYLSSEGECAAAYKIGELVRDVDMECKCADRMVLRLSASEYDMADIAQMQDILHEEYRKKAEDIGVHIR